MSTRKEAAGEQGLATYSEDMPAEAPMYRSELELIAGLRAGAKVMSREVVLGIGDDCAVLRPPVGHDVVVTTDFSLEGRHFRRDWHPAASVGHRTLARGLSDVAAMGAKPMAAFLSLALPRGTKKAWVDQFFEGLLALARETKTPLAGGDTARAPGGEVLADIVLLGTVPRGRALRRDGAKAGDALYVTGALGGAAAELKGLTSLTGQKLASRALAMRRRTDGAAGVLQVPRLGVGQALVRRGLASACMDVSDGLSTDLGHLCAASGVGAEVEADRLPLDARTQVLTALDGLQMALHGGEDYELLFTAHAETKIPKTLGGVTVTRIGTMKRLTRGKAPAIVLLHGDGRREPLLPQGWEHTF